jgi:hypothetical protein
VSTALAVLAALASLLRGGRHARPDPSPGRRPLHRLGR